MIISLYTRSYTYMQLSSVPHNTSLLLFGNIIESMENDLLFVANKHTELDSLLMEY